MLDYDDRFMYTKSNGDDEIANSEEEVDDILNKDIEKEIDDLDEDDEDFDYDDDLEYDEDDEDEEEEIEEE